MQVTQEIFVVEEWARDARNEARAEANSRAEAEKSLGALKQEKQELGAKLTAKEKVRRSAEARLKNLQDQVEDQCKKLYLTEIELSIQKHLVLHLKADLEKAKAAARAAEEATEASKQASYIRGIEEIEVRLAEELAEVCRDYCKATWVERPLTLQRSLLTQSGGSLGAYTIILRFVKSQLPSHLPLPLF